MKQEIRIELNEKDLKEVLSEHFKLDSSKATISISKFEGNQREPSYSKVTITAPRNNK